MRRFLLNRLEDETGISGIGIIAEGVEFRTGKCVLSWVTKYVSVAIYDDIDTLMNIHGHDGKTQLEYMDDEMEPDYDHT